MSGGERGSVYERYRSDSNAVNAGCESLTRSDVERPAGLPVETASLMPNSSPALPTAEYTCHYSSADPNDAESAVPSLAGQCRMPSSAGESRRRTRESTESSVKPRPSPGPWRTADRLILSVDSCPFLRFALRDIFWKKIHTGRGNPNQFRLSRPA